MTIKLFNRSEVIRLWNEGKTREEIKAILQLDLSTRQIQRIGVADGSWKLRMAARAVRLEAAKEKKRVVS
jgi:hypothetical protein